MQNSKKGFIAPLLIVVIVALTIGGGVYVYESKKSGTPTVDNAGAQQPNQNQQQVNTETPPVSTQQNSTNNKPVNISPTTETTKPVITSISKSSGPIGTTIELKGYRLLDNRGDQNLIIENSKGEVASFGFGNPEHIDLSKKYVSMKFALGEKVCKQWATDAGGSCTKGYMTIVPGGYKIYVAHNGFTDTSAMSNKVVFTVTADSPVASLPKTCVDQPQDGRTINSLDELEKPVITSLSQYSGSVGATIEILGCNFNGFESDLNIWIKNTQGVSGILYSEPGSTRKLMKVVLKSSACQTDESYRGLPCEKILNLIPGTYKIYTAPYGHKSNEVTFIVK